MQIANEYVAAAAFLDAAMKEIGALAQPADTRVLDLGCGGGNLVQALLAHGYDAYGCDLKPFWQDATGAPLDRFATITPVPYRLPFADGTFDIVVSTSVLEHVQDKPALFAETYRVLKPGGWAMHLFPGKWYLPVEPHIYVPLVNFFLPHCPRGWLALWAWLGVRNEYQHGKTWHQVVEANVRYCTHELSYWSSREYRALALQVFGDYAMPMEFYLRQGYGGSAKLLRRFPARRLAGWLVSQVRMSFIVSKKIR